MKIDTLLFDLDGTLVDSNECILESLRQTILHYMPDYPMNRSRLLDMMGPPLSITFQIYSKDPDVIREMIQYYRSIYTRLEPQMITLYPGVIEMLSYFKDQHMKIAIVTTKFKESAYPSIRHFGLDRYLDLVIGLDDVKNHKPHPEPVLKAMNELGSKKAIMTGDNHSDIDSGKYAGILTCAVDWSLKKEELSLSAPDYWIHSFQEFIKLVDSYNLKEE